MKKFMIQILLAILFILILTIILNLNETFFCFIVSFLAGITIGEFVIWLTKYKRK